MKSGSHSTPKMKFNAYILVFIICNFQIGVGIFGFPRFVYKEAGHDAWISILLIGAFIHLIVWVMVKTMEMHPSLDLYGIHHALFGKWVGGSLSILMMVYFIVNVAVILRTYVEAVQSWVFPDFPAWLLSLLLIFLVVYSVLGGIRVMFQISLIGFLIIIMTVGLCYYTLRYADWSRVLPIYDTTTLHLIKGALKMSFTVSGIEIIYFIYKYIKDKNKVMFHAQTGVLFTNILYFIIMLISVVYFSQNQIMHVSWGFINLLKIIKYPFLERIEFIVIPCWMFVVLEGAIILAWILLRGGSYLFGWNNKLVLYGVAIMVFVVSNCFQDQGQILKASDYLGYADLFITLIYPFLLFGMSHFVAWWHKVKEE